MTMRPAQVSSSTKLVSIPEVLAARGYEPVVVSGAGKELTYHCPLPGHDDVNSSFCVNTEKKVYHCHGCGRGGNVVGLIMKLHGVDRAGAIAGVNGGNWKPSHDGKTTSPFAEYTDPPAKVQGGLYPRASSSNEEPWRTSAEPMEGSLPGDHRGDSSGPGRRRYGRLSHRPRPPFIGSHGGD
jgi:hypothetical protein